MIDLKALYGRSYRITLDESASLPGQTRADRLWYYRIPCKYGHIYVHGRETLGACTDRRMMRGRLAAVPGVAVHQRGDSELSVTFPPAIFPQVAELLQARKRRVLTPEQKAAAAARLARHRFSPRTSGPLSAPDSGPGVPGGGNAPPGAGDAPGA